MQALFFAWSGTCCINSGGNEISGFWHQQENESVLVLEALWHAFALAHNGHNKGLTVFTESLTKASSFFILCRVNQHNNYSTMRPILFLRR